MNDVLKILTSAMALERYASGSINASAYCSGAPTQMNEQMAIMNWEGYVYTKQQQEQATYYLT